MNHCQPIKDDDVTEALSSVANNSGSIPRIRQKPIGWSFEDWKRCFQHGSGKIRFGCCTDNLGNSQYLRAVQGHSGGANLDAKLQSNIKMPCGRTNISVDLLCDYWSIAEGCRIAGGISSQKGRPACVFTAVDPMFTPLFEENEPRMIPYTMKWRSYEKMLRTKDWNFITQRAMRNYDIITHQIS